MKFGPPDAKQSQMMLLGCGSSGAGVSFTGVLDDYTSNLSGLWSIRRRLLTSYASNLFLVRRSSDDTTLAIGYGSDGEMDEAALTAFVGANSGYIVTVYDQSGNGFNWTNAVAAEQPAIILSGTMQVDDDGFPAMYLDGTDDHLAQTVDRLDISGASSCQVWLKVTTNNPANNGRIFDLGADKLSAWLDYGGTVYWDFDFPGGRISGATPAGIVGSTARVSFENDAGSGVVRVNGTSQITGSLGGGLLTAGSETFTLGQATAGSGQWKGLITEMAIWKTGVAATCIARDSALAA